MFLSFPVELQPLKASSIHNVAKNLQGPSWQIFSRSKTLPRAAKSNFPPKYICLFFFFFLESNAFHHFMVRQEI